MLESISIAKIFGMINIVYIPLTFYICWHQGGKFSFFHYPLSYASKTRIRKYYSLSLVLIAVFQMIFMTGVFSTLPEQPTTLLLGLFYSGMIGLAMSGVIHGTTNKLVHRFSIIYMVVSITLWSFLFSLDFTALNQTVGWMGVGLSMIALIGVPVLYIKTKAFGMSEILFAALTVLWNILYIF